MHHSSCLTTPHLHACRSCDGLDMHVPELLKALNHSFQPWVRPADAENQEERVPCGAEDAQVGCIAPVLLLFDEGRADGS